MSFRNVVRQSKFRHVFGKQFKRDECYDGIKVSANSWDSPFCDANSKFLAVINEAQGGGSFQVIPLEKTGRLGLNYPRVCGHQSTVLDVKWCPTNDNMIASASEDCIVKIWEIPDGGLQDDLRESLVDLEGHQRRVGIIEWHPTAENVLLSAGFDYMIFIWNLNTGTAIKELDMHSDTIFTVAWNSIGSHIVTTCKDKTLRYIDARSGALVSECAKAHEGAKARAIFVNEYPEPDRIFTTGLTRMSERQIGLWNPTDMSKPLHIDVLDRGSGVLFTKFDPDTHMVYVYGKGDGNIRYYEIQGDKVFDLSAYSDKNPQRGVAWLPKTSVNVNACEIMRAFRLTSNGQCLVVEFTVPRKSTLFQDDLYPDTRSAEPCLTAEEWAAGSDPKALKKLSLKDNFVGEKRTVKAGGLGARKGGLAGKGLGGGAAVAAAAPEKKPAAAAKPAASAGGAGDSKRIAELEALIAAKDAVIAEKDAIIAKQAAEIKKKTAFLATLADLEAE